MQALHFDNRFVRELPADPEAGPRRRQVHRALYSRVDPTPVAQPRLIAYSPEVAALLDGMEPYAANYGGHQFGQWAGQLGDGRAISLGEVVNSAGQRWELQLKG